MYRQSFILYLSNSCAKNLSLSPFLICFRCFTPLRLSRRSSGRKRRGGGRKRRGKKSGKALASPALATSYSAATSVLTESRVEKKKKKKEHTHSPQGMAWLVDPDDSEGSKSCPHLYKSQVLKSGTLNVTQKREVEVSQFLTKAWIAVLLQWFIIGKSNVVLEAKDTSGIGVDKGNSFLIT